ncbi:STAS/SEC14 domain-containing protein [Pontibacter ummariensis]|nr:STAS/SEC14 domain-containing protein [Pontibacter ummariensis]
MIQVLEESKEDIVAFRISGKVDKNDYQVMLPVLEEKIRQHGKVRVYAEMQDVEEYSLEALWDEIRYDISHATDFSRVAIVGGRRWTNWLTNLAKPFTSAEVKYYDFSDRSKAWSWIHEGAPLPGDRGQNPQHPS